MHQYMEWFIYWVLVDTRTTASVAVMPAQATNVRLEPVLDPG